jgi:TolB protein
MHRDGSEARQLTSDNRLDTDAAWSPDRQRIVFTKLNDTTTALPPGAYFEVYVMDADGSDVRQLTHRTDGSDRHPRWSPDGTQIVFSRSSSAGTAGVFVMNSDGSNIRPLFTGTGNWPDWSPDGSKILFTNDFRLSVMNANGSSVITFGNSDVCPGFLRAARWSPDGSRIAFTCDVGGTVIYTMRHDGADVRLVREREPGTMNVGAPVWSPDGRYIAFSHDDGTHDFFIIDSLGGDEERITDDTAIDVISDWR